MAKHSGAAIADPQDVGTAAVPAALRAARQGTGAAAICEVDRGARAAPTRSSRPTWCRLLWERCVQRDGRSWVANPARPTAARHEACCDDGAAAFTAPALPVGNSADPSTITRLRPAALS
jgi:hypothetical protein